MYYNFMINDATLQHYIKKNLKNSSNFILIIYKRLQVNYRSYFYFKHLYMKFHI